MVAAQDHGPARGRHVRASRCGASAHRNRRFVECADRSRVRTSHMAQRGARGSRRRLPCRRNTPLHAASINNHTEMVELLIAAGADPEQENQYG
jgi:hypothetical protein